MKTFRIFLIMGFLVLATRTPAASLTDVFSGRHGANWGSYLANNPNLDTHALRLQLLDYYHSLPNDPVSSRIKESVLVEYGNFAVEKDGHLAADAEAFYASNLKHIRAEDDESVALLSSMKNATSVETAGMLNQEIEELPPHTESYAVEMLGMMYSNQAPESSANTDHARSPTPNLYIPLQSRSRQSEWIKVNSDSAELFARLLRNRKTPRIVLHQIENAQKISYGFLKNSASAFSRPANEKVSATSSADGRSIAAAGKAGGVMEVNAITGAETQTSNTSSATKRWAVILLLILGLGAAFYLVKKNA